MIVIPCPDKRRVFSQPSGSSWRKAVRFPIVSFLARHSMSEALLLQAFRLDHLSVRTCEQSPHTWIDFYAVWGDGDRVRSGSEAVY